MSDLAVDIERLRDRGLHAILFRNAGVGLQFYEGPFDEEGQPPADWRRFLIVRRYYPTLIEAVNAEIAERVSQSP